MNASFCGFGMNENAMRVLTVTLVLNIVVAQH